MNVLLCLLKDIRSQYSCKWGVWVLSLRCQSQVYASASCCGSCRSGAEGKDALTEKRWRSVVKQREKYGGSETEQHLRKCNKEAESETVKGLLFCSARTQMRRRYFMCFPVGVWPPGAAPTSACLSGYKLSAADVTEWRETGLWGGAVEVILEAQPPNSNHHIRMLVTVLCEGQFALKRVTVNNGRKRGASSKQSLPCALSSVCLSVVSQCGQISSLVTHSHLELLQRTPDS